MLQKSTVFGGQWENLTDMNTFYIDTSQQNIKGKHGIGFGTCKSHTIDRPHYYGNGSKGI